MKYFNIILLLLSFSAFAQEKVKTDDGRIVILNHNGTWHYEKTKSVNSSNNYSIPEKRTFNHPQFSKKITANYYLDEKYDKYKDITVVSLMVSLNRIDPDLSIGAYFIYDGKEVKTPSALTLSFVSKSEDWKYLRSSTLYFLVDGKRLNIGEMEREGSVGNGYVLEFLSVSIPTETFLKIISGSEIEGQLFTTEFKLSEEQLEAFKDFASRMN
jgi:hypothetical protein